MNATTNNPNNQLTKHCKACDRHLPATTEYFGARKRYKDGLHYKCIECEKAYQAGYRDANHERLVEYDKNRYANNREERLVAMREFYKRNSDRIKSQTNAYYWANREEISAKRRQKWIDNPDEMRSISRDYYWANRDHMIERMRNRPKPNPERRRATQKKYRTNNDARVKKSSAAYRTKNREQIRERVKAYKVKRPEVYRTAQLRRRARKTELPNTFTAEQWQACLDYFGGCCAVCNRPLYGIFHSPNGDHWRPLSSPECLGSVAKNIVPLCGGIDGCNQRKGSKDPLEWLNDEFGPRKARQIAKRVQAYFDSLPDE